MNCPECGDALKVGAKRCGCGWVYGGAKESRPATVSKSWDNRCTYEARGQRCCYPVGWYDQGATSGWCFFHRTLNAKEDWQKAADLVNRSSGVTPHRYLEEVFAAAYPVSCPKEFEELQARTAKVQDERSLFRGSGKTGSIC